MYGCKNTENLLNKQRKERKKFGKCKDRAEKLTEKVGE